jgi:hypothetical protein
MSLPAKNYTAPGLDLGWGDTNPWLVGSLNYSKCITKYFSSFRTRIQLEKELARPDINDVCKQELDDLRSIVSDIRYKEVLGHQYELAKNDFYEDLTVQNRP